VPGITATHVFAVNNDRRTGLLKAGERRVRLFVEIYEQPKGY
jgi:hypothetical protein